MQQRMVHDTLPACGQGLSPRDPRCHDQHPEDPVGDGQHQERHNTGLRHARTQVGLFRTLPDYTEWLGRVADETEGEIRRRQVVCDLLDQSAVPIQNANLCLECHHSLSVILGVLHPCLLRAMIG